jgi:hypothetical protein
MPDRNERRGELSPHRQDEAAPPDPKPRPNTDTRDDGRGRDASRTGSKSNAS